MDGMNPRRLAKEKYLAQSYPLRVFQFTFPPHTDVHWHEFYELHLVLSGNGVHILNGSKYELKRGNMFLLSPADFHEIISSETDPVRIYNLIFTDELLSETLRELIFPDRRVPVVDVPEEEMAFMESEFEFIIKESIKAQPGQKMMIQGALERILTILSRLCRGLDGEAVRQRSGQPSNLHHPAIAKAFSYIHYHFRTPLTLNDAAKEARLTPNYFSDMFRKTAGISFQSYLQELRLRYAQSLLTVSKLPVTEICYASGFNTLSHFERAFKKKYGDTPRAYRQKQMVAEG